MRLKPVVQRRERRFHARGEIPEVILRSAHQHLVICNVSISTGVFPERWRRANIIPIFKKGDKKDPSNYRSVSLLPLFGKILERLVYDQLYRHVSPALCNEQHGFIPRRSCITNLAVYLQSAWEAISDGYQTDVIYIQIIRLLFKA